jgi:hypothetical protein
MDSAGLSERGAFATVGSPITSLHSEMDSPGLSEREAFAKVGESTDRVERSETKGSGLAGI